MNARQRSQNAVRNAYGAFLPSASTNFGTSYRQGKPQFFAGVQFGSNSDIMSSSWGLNFNASMSANTFANLRRTQANEDASDNDVRDAEQALVSGVTQQYLFVLQTAARAAVQDSLISSTQLQLELARAKAGVGSATSLDVLRAVEGAVASIELVDSRVADWKIKLPDTVGDMASSGSIVIGGSITPLDDLDLRLALAAGEIDAHYQPQVRLSDGTTLDYDTALLSKGFVFNNPNAKATCGCGSSFGA